MWKIPIVGQLMNIVTTADSERSYVQNVFFSKIVEF